MTLIARLKQPPKDFGRFVLSRVLCLFVWTLSVLATGNNVA